MSKLFQAGLSLTRGPIARSSIQSVIIRVAGLAISFVQAVLAARILGAQGYGVAAVVLSVAQIGATVAACGFGALAVREIPRLRAATGTGSVAAFVAVGLRWVVLLGLLVGGLLSAVALAGLVPASYRPALLAGSLVVLPMALLQLQRGAAQGLGRIVAAQVPGELFRPMLFVCFLSVVAIAQMRLLPEVYVAAFAAAASVVLVVALPLTFRGNVALHTINVPPPEARRLRIEAAPFLGIALVGMLLGEINTLMLGWLATPREAGLFQPVARIAPLMALPIQAAGMRFAPRIAELWEQGKWGEVERLRVTFTRATVTLTVLAAVTLAVAGPLLMSAFGSEFAGSARLLWIVAAAQIVNAAFGPVGMLLTMRGRANAALAGQVAGLAVNCLLGVILIPAYGALGAAVSMAIGIVAWNVVMAGLIRHEPRSGV